MPQISAPPEAPAVKTLGKSSPLLRLPVEIRQTIWRSLLGDNFIHIQQTAIESSCKSSNLGPKERWLVWICIQSFGSEQRQQIARHLDDESKRSNFQIPWCTKYDDVTRVPCQIGRCPGSQDGLRALMRTALTNPGGVRRLCLPQLQSLRVCRQAYNEAFPIFWSSNTFSYSNQDEFDGFMNLLNVRQKGLISRLAFNVGIHSWRRSMSRSTLDSLQNLTRLDVHMVFLNLYFPYSVQWWEMDDASEQAADAKERWNMSMRCHYKGILDFRVLPLQKVITEFVSEKFSENKLTTLADNTGAQWAVELRQRLLTPERFGDWDLLEVAQRRMG